MNSEAIHIGCAQLTYRSKLGVYSGYVGVGKLPWRQIREVFILPDCDIAQSTDWIRLPQLRTDGECVVKLVVESSVPALDVVTWYSDFREGNSSSWIQRIDESLSYSFRRRLDSALAYFTNHGIVSDSEIIKRNEIAEKVAWQIEQISAPDVMIQAIHECCLLTKIKLRRDHDCLVVSFAFSAAWEREHGVSLHFKNMDLVSVAGEHDC